MKNASLYESNFIERTYPSIVSDMSIAFAELVANAWDAGATRVDIVIPEKFGGKIVITDNGSGMTDEEFRNRWMVMAYNRVAHQGERIEFVTDDKVPMSRLAYGRNGVGRHSLICFNDFYTIDTWKNGQLNHYEISAMGGNAAFSIDKYETSTKEGSGTSISVDAIKRCPDTKAIIQTLGFKFMFDPLFNIFVNGQRVEYHNTMKADRSDTINMKYGSAKLNIYLIPEGEKSTTNNGIAIWVNNRLVGKPTWMLGEKKVEDARRKFALKHIIIVKADFLIDDINFDWSDFKRTQKVLDTFTEIVNYLRKYRLEYYKGRTSEVRNDVIRANKDLIRKLSIPAAYNLKAFFETYLEQRPEVETEDLNIIIASLVNVLSNENGISLLAKLSTMTDASIKDLDNILEEWSVSDIKNVLSEINNRILVIDAMQKLSADKSIDELHILHPLVSQAKWLFGIEYDNPN